MPFALNDYSPEAQAAEFERRQLVPGPIQQPAWIDTCREVFGIDQDTLRFEIDDDSGYASAEFMRLRSAPSEPWRLIGVDELHEPMDLVYDSLPALDQLTRQMIKSGELFRLGRIRADSPTIDSLERAAGRFGAVITRPTANYPSIVLDDSWRVPESKLNSGRRSDYRRAQKRALEWGALRFEVISPTPDALPGLLEEAFQVEARSWKGEAGTALLCDPVRAEFYRRYAARACAAGNLRLNFMYFGERLGAMQIAVEQDQALWLLKVGYDTEFSRCSPGNLMIGETIRAAVESGLSRYEFLGVSETWTRVWTETEHETVAVRVYPLGIANFSQLACDGVKSLWRNRRGDA